MQYEIFVDFSTRKLVFFCGTYPRASNKRRRELRALRRGYGEHFYKADSPDRFTKGFIKRSTNKLRNHTYRPALRATSYSRNRSINSKRKKNAQ